MKARYLRDGKEETVVIHCPGCNDKHYLNINPNKHLDIPEGRRPCWTFNRDMNNPTFSPSLLVRTRIYVNPDYKKQISEEDWDHFERTSVICHSFIKEGTIQYLSDCTHSLKNTTIELPDVETLIAYE
jgi:hypothetical protein